MVFDVNKLASYPLEPGVYIMKSNAGTILYIGKAKQLKSRLKQYFIAGGDGRWIIPYLQELVTSIETVITPSEKEALLLENTLIKKHRPRFNALLKDDKTYAAIKINHRHPWPMLSLIRYKGKPKEEAHYFGPYTSAHGARQTLDLLQRLFPLRQCSDQELLRRTRPCILHDMGRCSAPCVGLVNPETYRGYVDAAEKFLRGDSEEIITSLKKQREIAVEQLEFERAKELHGLILSIENTLQTQRVDKPLGGLTGDVLAIFRQGDEVILSQLMFFKGKLHAFSHHNFNKIIENDEELFESFILQEYKERQDAPSEILVPLELQNRESLEEILNQARTSKKISISFPQRGERKALLEMAFKNAEAAFSQKKDEGAIRGKHLLELKEKLHLMRYPKLIECIDTSHFSGNESVSALVCFFEGLPDKMRYRRYKLKNSPAGDDYSALKEVLTRRYDKNLEEQDLPDLLIIDGGKGHLNCARKIFEELNIASVDLVGFAKEAGRHDKGITQDQIYLPNLKDPLLFPPHSPILFLLQRLRDEAHRFAISYQKKRRSKSVFHSELLEVPGIGPKKLKTLLKWFGSIKKLREATDEEFLKIKGLNRRDRENLKKFSSS